MFYWCVCLPPEICEHIVGYPRSFALTFNYVKLRVAQSSVGSDHDENKKKEKDSCFSHASETNEKKK